MKELEDKIQNILAKNQYCCPIAGVVGELESSMDIAKEIKDIAIDFANYQDDFDSDKFTLNALWTKFIKERYKP